MPRSPKNALLLTHKGIKALRPGATRVDWMDTQDHGFGVIVRPSGRKTFIVRYRIGRVERRLTLGDFPKMTLKEARSKAREALGRVEGGDDPQAEKIEKRGAMTFGELAASYLDHHAKEHKKSWKEDRRILKKDLLPAWRNLPAAEIRRRDVAQLLDRIMARSAPIMANRTRALISKIFAFALSRDVAEVNPVGGLPRPGEERRRERVLSEEEIRTLWGIWEAEDSISSAAFRMLLLTAQRKQEVLAMRWGDVHGPWWTIPAGIVKNKLTHRVYLGSAALLLLGDLRERPGRSDWVFASPRRKGSAVASLNTAKRRFRTAAGFRDWTPHDLRRTAATYMGRMGVPRSVIARVLNHADSGVTAVYDRSTGEPEIEDALRRWDRRLDEILAGPEALANVVSIR
jgi:integrase